MPTHLEKYTLYISVGLAHNLMVRNELTAKTKLDSKS